MLARPPRRRMCNSIAILPVSFCCFLLLLLGVERAEAAPKTDDHTRSGLTATADEAAGYAPVSMPPLPFRQPQIGPDLKRAFAHDVERRTTAFVPKADAFPLDFEVPDEEKWIRVDLGKQMVFAYEHDQPVRAFIISSGLPGTPTVTGEFRIRAKVRAQTMSGGDPDLGTYYSLPNVEWVQYFYADYGFHGTYWHNDFGTPKSHGCINMTNADARWLFDWAGPDWTGDRIWQAVTEENPGTYVLVHQ